jgi:hypothetical protein
MEGGYCICRIDDKGKKDMLTIITQQRYFELRFESAHVAQTWKTTIDLTLSKQVKVEKYKKRERMQK